MIVTSFIRASTFKDNHRNDFKNSVVAYVILAYYSTGHSCLSRQLTNISQLMVFIDVGTKFSSVKNVLPYAVSQAYFLVLSYKYAVTTTSKWIPNRMRLIYHPATINHYLYFLTYWTYTQLRNDLSDNIYWFTLNKCPNGHMAFIFIRLLVQTVHHTVSWRFHWSDSSIQATNKYL